jgi:hypothetical protein
LKDAFQGKLNLISAVQNTYTEKNLNSSSRAIAHQNVGRAEISMPAVPVVQNQIDIAQKQTDKEEEPLQMKTETAQLQGAEEKELQMKPFQLKSDVIQRQEPGDKEPLQGKFIPVQRKVNTTGLPDNLKSGVENLSGIDISDVKVHYNSAKPAQLQALAYAQGTDIHIGPGQEKHLPHEAWHVVQQKQGRVKPTMQMKEGVAVNDDKGLEHEADMMGGLIAAPELGEDTEKRIASLAAPGSSAVAQMVWVEKGLGGFYWHQLIDGLQWFYDGETERFYFHIVDDLAVHPHNWNKIEALEGEMLTEKQLDDIGFHEIEEAPHVVPHRAKSVEGAGMVSRQVAELIIGNIRSGIPPFKPELGLGGCSWFIWKGFGIPYTSIDKVKRGEPPKDIAIGAVISLVEFPLMITTQFLADRHAMIMNDPEFNADTERRFREYKELGDKGLNNKDRANLLFYRKGLAEQQMWVSIGVMANLHPSKVGVVSLDGSDFSKSGNGKFLVVADATKIRLEKDIALSEKQ